MRAAGPSGRGVLPSELLFCLAVVLHTPTSQHSTSHRTPTWREGGSVLSPSPPSGAPLRQWCSRNPHRCPLPQARTRSTALAAAAAAAAAAVAPRGSPPHPPHSWNPERRPTGSSLAPVGGRSRALPGFSVAILRRQSAGSISSVVFSVLVRGVVPQPRCSFTLRQARGQAPRHLAKARQVRADKESISTMLRRIQICVRVRSTFVHLRRNTRAWRTVFSPASRIVATASFHTSWFTAAQRMPLLFFFASSKGHVLLHRTHLKLEYNYMQDYRRPPTLRFQTSKFRILLASGAVKERLFPPDFGGFQSRIPNRYDGPIPTPRPFGRARGLLT